MSYQVITDFRGGLDARKYKLSLPPGTLTKLVNGHITAGGEIEKRKAFVKLTSTGNTNSLPAGTFGSQPTGSGVVVFSSSDLSASNFPTNFSCQRLQHPAVLAGYSYDGTKHAMTAIIHSQVFGSYILALAKFADGYEFAYYNGALVDDFTAGLVLPFIYNGGTNTSIRLAKHLAALVNNTSNYTAIQNASPNDYEFDVFSQPGNNYSVNVSVSSASNLNIVTGSDTGYTSSTISGTTGTNAGNGSTISIGGKTYTLKTTLSTEGDVLIGGTIGVTLTNLFNAINHTGTPGTDYQCAAINANVMAQNLILAGNPSFQIVSRTANTGGVTANSITAVNYSLQSSTVVKQIATNAQGLFKIVAANQSTFAVGVIASTATTPVAGHTITVGSKTYTFKSSVSTTANEVKIGSSPLNALDNLILAINATPSGSGTAYGSATTANASCTAGTRVGSGSGAYSTLTAITSGTAGNSIALSQSNSDYTLTAFSGGVTSQVSNIKIGPVFASGSFTSNGTNPSNGDSVTIGATIYTFKNTLAAEGDIQIGAGATETLLNLIAAINQTGIANYDYQVTSLNAQVTALPTLNGGVLQLIARTAGANGNSISLSVTGSTLTASAGTLTGGNDSMELLASAVLVNPGQTLNDYANSVVAAINSNSATSGYKAKKSDQTIYVNAVAGNSFSNGADISITTSGQVAIGFCAFKLIVSGTISSPAISSVQVNGTTITNASVPYSTTTDALASALASNINNASNTNNNGVYVAVAQGSVIYLSKVITSSADYVGTVVINTSGTGLTISEVGNSGLTAVVSPTYIQLPNNGYSISAGVAVCNVTGGYPPYQYAWQYDSGDASFNALNPTAPNTNFARQDNGGSNTGKMKCQVTDSLGNIAKSNPVTLYQP